MSDKATLTKAATEHLASANVAGFLLSLFETMFLPILPGILLQLAPKIKTSAKLQKVLKDVDAVIQGLLSPPV